MVLGVITTLLLSAGAAVQLDLDACAERRIDRQALARALELELSHTSTTETRLVLRCGAGAAELELAYGGRTEPVQLAPVTSEDRARLVALFAAELAHAGPPPAPPPVRSEEPLAVAPAAVSPAVVPRPTDPWQVSIRAEAAGALSSGTLLGAVGGYLEGPEDMLLGPLSPRVGVMLLVADLDKSAAFGFGVRAGVGAPLFELGGARLEAELMGGAGVVGAPRPAQGYAEARLGLLARFSLGDGGFVALGSLAADAVAPAGFALSLAGGIALPACRFVSCPSDGSGSTDSGSGDGRAAPTASGRPAI
jgi:hypothetical protein